jgi:hypothetical protein
MTFLQEMEQNADEIQNPLGRLCGRRGPASDCARAADRCAHPPVLEFSSTGFNTRHTFSARTFCPSAVG